VAADQLPRGRAGSAAGRQGTGADNPDVVRRRPVTGVAVYVSYNDTRATGPRESPGGPACAGVGRPDRDR
jgi:hypothetical protein